MSEHIPPNNDIPGAVDTAMKGSAPVSAERVRRQLRRMTRQLRLYFLRANQKSRHSAVEEWLCDNYYVLEKESKQAQRDIRQLARRAVPGELERFYKLFETVLFSCMPPLCDETIAEILTCAEKRRHSSENQFSFIPAALKAVLVRMAYAACFEAQSEAMISYAVMGLGKLSSIDFEEAVYSCSRVERVLCRDPAGVYPCMDSDSRRHYRHMIAKIAARARKPEEDIAKEFLDACEREQGVRRHIGWHILRAPSLLKPRKRRGIFTLFCAAVLPALLSAGLGFWTGSVAVGLFCFLPLWEILRIPLWQFALTGVDVDFIPRMDLKKVSDKPKTVVLVSTLLPAPDQAPALADRLEQLYFSNTDPDMYYCVLADFKEWEFPADEKDDSQVAACRKRIESLNARYGERFMLFLRARVYNRTQNRYSGWERKRGAITEFIRFLRGGKTSLHTFVGDRGILPDIRYIIALDSDTNLLFESAQTLVSAAIHPLNAPVPDENGVVRDGYGILVPKISPDLASAKATSFSRVMCGCGGVTAYETRDKDFYQDLFSESIFAGKGLIDVDAFNDLLSERFPENRILSHDILEGAYLRTGFVSDVEMTDTAPSGMSSWLSRLHRWIRGDWQNVVFLARRYRAGGRVYRNPIGALSRYKLLDNLRRSLTPAASFACVTAALFMSPARGVIPALAGLLAVLFPSLWAAAFSLMSGGVFTLSRKFFTRALPHALELIGQGAYQLVMLPAQTIVILDAVVRSLWRTFVSGRKMLEWTTAAQSELRSVTLRALLARFWPAALMGLAYLWLAFPGALSLPGAAFSLFIPAALLTARPSVEDGRGLSGADRDALISYNAAMWRYYEDFADRENHWLPPDNIQQSPVYRVANRTSPTNIGMMLLSVLAARDFGFIDTAGLHLRVERTVAAVEQLKTYHGNLYNWYDTQTLDTLKPEYVSTVDSGNFICCLIALAEGLREHLSERPELDSLIRRVERLIDSADLTVFYNKKKKLFSIGYDAQTGELSNSYYDFLLSEARLTSYYAVARKIVGKKHWGALIRTMSRSGSYAGAVSWTGTMFEYFMPHLLLPVHEGSLLGETLLYCLYCQKRRVKTPGVPWGISESAFYAFDNNLNYQYKAHGVQKLGVKRHLDRELVISPYSTFLTIAFNPNSSMRNLRELRMLGVYGRYGFYEAVDFTAGRVGPGGLAVIRSYMAHHIGMSMVASCNALLENRMQRRFMRNRYMRSADEFLQEKIARSTVVYDELKNTQSRGERHERPRMREESSAIYPQAPRCTLLSNGELTDILTDCGAGYLKFGDVDLTRRSGDLLRRPQGIFTLVRVSGRTICATRAPFYDPDTAHSVEYGDHSVTYYAKQGDAEIGVRCLIHPTVSCEQRQIVVKRTAASKEPVQALIYLEPILCAYQDWNAHPAFSKLFVSARYDSDTKTLTFARRERDGSAGVFLTVGFLQDVAFSYETRRENLMSAPLGLSELKAFHKKAFTGGSGTPDACCALRFELPASTGGQHQATFLLCAARSEAEGISAVITMRRQGGLDGKTAAAAPLPGDSLEGRLGSGILGQLLFCRSEPADSRARTANTLGQSGLWSAGISGDFPIALVETGDVPELEALQSYLRLHVMLMGFKVEFDLVIVYKKERDRDAIMELVREGNVTGILGSRGGVFLLHRESLPAEVYTLLRAAARHIFENGSPGYGERGLSEYKPVRPLPLTPAPMPASPSLSVSGGAFDGGRFHADKNSPLPWCHVLANPVFGTLVSDCALGFTWAVNSRENKLTPWYNDICSDNTGELILLADGTRVYNLTHGARASFSREDARYSGRGGDVESVVVVGVSKRGCAKYIDVTLRNRSDSVLKLSCAYYIEPVLGVNRDTAWSVQACRNGGVLILKGSYNTAVRSCAALTARDTSGGRFITDRALFLSGQWQGEGISQRDDPCAALVLPAELPPRGEWSARFVLAWGATPDSALFMATAPLDAGLGEHRENSLRISTPDKALNEFINNFCPHQILASRLRGRTAFYQCGGAYGFRDQLQDAMAYRLFTPELLKRQIIRCCAVQFEEGDVLHWWHPLPKSGGGLRGVRTRFSDDLLWLPLAASEYLEQTGDESLLSARVRYLRAPELSEHEHEKYISPSKSEETDDVFGHCVRALERGHRLGENGLPLIGCGDWNDGFSAVGLGGKGRSVWLALFLSIVLDSFAPVCELRGRSDLAEEYRNRARALRENVDAHCWDGQWYVRAFYDGGDAMGSNRQSECAIDLLPQSFAVLAGMPCRERVESGMNSALQRLHDEKQRLMKLFDPPFQHSAQKPGYVKAYPSGIRENGGQYTHAAIWFAIALLRMGKTDEGWRLLRMLNPADRALSAPLAGQYRLEPYYLAADIYSASGVAGRGGWSIYTGAAAWYLRAVYEELLGLKIMREGVTFSPRLPASWDEASLDAQIGCTKMRIKFTRAQRPGLLCDGAQARSVPLDGGEHSVIVYFD